METSSQQTLINNLKSALARRKAELSEKEYWNAILSTADGIIKFDKNHLTPAKLSIFPFTISEL
jgi:hypothetical protein